MSNFSVIIINKNSLLCFMVCTASCEPRLEENDEKPKNIQKISKQSF